MDIVIVDDPSNPLSEDALAAGAKLGAAPGKLTKSFLMAQPEGVFLASNLMKEGFESVFAEPIGRAEFRAAQWERIRAAGAHQRMCAVFATEAHYKCWAEEQRAYFLSQAR